jgi:hypothetical protein
MIRPITSTSCDQRSRSRESCAFPALELRPLVRLADAPLRLEPSTLYEAVQGGIERAGLDPEQIVGLLSDRLADAVAVLRTPLKGAENEPASTRCGIELVNG